MSRGIRWSFVFEKTTNGRRINESDGNSQLQFIKKQVLRKRSQGFKARISRLHDPETIEEPDGSKKFKYTAQLNVINDVVDVKVDTNEVASLRQIIEEKVTKAAASQKGGRWVFAREIPYCKIDNSIKLQVPDGPISVVPGAVSAPSVKPPFVLPVLEPQTFETNFSGIFEREPQIRIIYDSLRTFMQSGKKKRSHVILYGKPASAKTTIFGRFKEWIENYIIKHYDIKDVTAEECERIKMIDATTASKAGFEKEILNAAKAGMLPEVICLEEIEKFQPDRLLSLLAIMDQRAAISRMNARIGHQIAETPVIIWATCNDEDELKGFHKGALWSRFTHQVRCTRPSFALMEKILLREIVAMSGNPAWIKPAIDIMKEVLISNDPRKAIGLLDGGDRLLTGEYRADLEAIKKAGEEEEKYNEE